MLQFHSDDIFNLAIVAFPIYSTNLLEVFKKVLANKSNKVIVNYII